MTAPSASASRATSHSRAIGIVRALIVLPVALVLTDAVAFHLANRSSGTLVSSGKARAYLVHVPPQYTHATPTPLVIRMHGAGGWPAQQRDLSGWNRVADAHGFIVVYPSGAEGEGPRIWHIERGAALDADVRFIRELIDTLRASYNIDSTRIFANGLSAGGGMSFALSCTLADRIAAVGMVAPALVLPWSWCTDRHAIPVIVIHGTADPVTPYHGGKTRISPRSFPDIPAWTASWARRNRCGATPQEVVVAPDVTRFEYANCADAAAVVLYRVQGGGHAWPGGHPLPEWLVGPTSQSVDATAMTWAFFERHPLVKR